MDMAFLLRPDLCLPVRLGAPVWILFVALGAAGCKKDSGPATQAPAAQEDERLGQGSPQQAEVEQLVAQGSYADAVAKADALLSTHPQDAGLYYAKAAALSRMEQGEASRAALAKAIEVDANFVPAYVAMARDLAFGVGELEQAEGYAKKAVALDSKHAEAGLVLAMIQHDRGQKDQAVATLEGLLNQGVRQAPVYIELGRLYAAAQFLEKARGALGQAIKMLPPKNSVPARLLLGRIELSARDVAAAQSAFDGAIAAEPDNPDIPLAVVRAYLRADQPKLAEPYAQKVIQAVPDQAPAQVAMARVMLGQGKVQGPGGALEWIEKARAQSPSSVAVKYAHALVLAGAGQCAKAKEAAAQVQGHLSRSRAGTLAAKLESCRAK